MKSKTLYAEKYGRTPAPIDPEVKKLAIGDEPQIDHRPADDIAPQMESLKAKLAAAGYPNADIDDVLSYALFPDVALAYFKNTVDLNTQKLCHKTYGFLCILCVYGFFFCLLQLFFCYFQHQLDPVHLIDLAGIRVTIKRNDIRLRISAQKLADHALAGNMIRQAGKRLQADDIIYAAAQQLGHLGSQQQPSPAILPVERCFSAKAIKADKGS